MIFAKMKKPVSLLALASVLISLMIFVNDSFASATWLSSITNVKVPTRVALDSQGNLFVTEPHDVNSVTVFDRHGNYVTALGGLQNPVGIAVSGSKVYIGNQGSKSVDVYTYANGKFTFSTMLGTGAGRVQGPACNRGKQERNDLRRRQAGPPGQGIQREREPGAELRRIGRELRAVQSCPSILQLTIMLLKFMLSIQASIPTKTATTARSVSRFSI